MLCTIGATVSRAGLVAGYPFEGNLSDYSGNGYHGIPYEGSPDPSSGSLYLDGASSVMIPIPACVFSGDTDFSIVAWFKTSVAEGGVIISSGPGGEELADHSMAAFISSGEPGLPGEIWYDNFSVGEARTETSDLDDDMWHHYAIVYNASGPTITTYIDGVVDDAGDDFDPDFPCEGVTTLIGDSLNTDWPLYFGEDHWNGLLDDVGIYDEALDAAGVAVSMNDGFAGCFCCGPMHLLRVVPNMITVYEEGETIGDFDVSLRCEPNNIVTVTIDPDPCSTNPNQDFVLLGDTAPDGSIALTFDPNDWDIPQTVAFQAIDDDLEEGPDINERHYIRLTTACADPNWDGRTTNLTVTVQDNDYVDILFTVTWPEQSNPKIPVTGPVQLWEEPRNFFGIPMKRWRNIGVTLQMAPDDGDPCTSVDTVKLQAIVEGEVAGDNLPLTDPCLPYEESDEPNGLIFTADNYNISQTIKIWANDDEVLQALDATSEGDQNYQANIVFTVIDDGGDERYTGLEKEVQFNIEDNECGAWGISYLDIGNPYYLMSEEDLGGDPNNWVDEDRNPLPDCYIDIYDLVEMASGWLNCTNPQDENCWSML
jgi:hypothetical protein